MSGDSGVVMATHHSEEPVFLVLQFLEEEGYHTTARQLEIDSGLFFNMDYFEELVLCGSWDRAETYLSSFTKYDDNRFSTKIYFELRKQNYLEALDNEDRARALEILNRDLKVFAAYNGELFKEMTQLLTLNDIRQNESLSTYIDEKTSRRIMVNELKKIIEANPLFEGKLKFPNMKAQRLRCLMNQGSRRQYTYHPFPIMLPQIDHSSVDHVCQSDKDVFSRADENIIQLSKAPEDYFDGWSSSPSIAGHTVDPSAVVSQLSYEGDAENFKDTADSRTETPDNKVTLTNIEPAQPDQRQEPASDMINDLPRTVIWTFNEDSRPTNIDFHPLKHSLLLVGTSIGDIGLWEVYSGKKLSSRNFKVWDIGACSMAFKAAMIKDPHVSINRIVWSPDGSCFGAAYSKHMVQLYFYDMDRDLQQHLEIDAHVGAVTDLAFSAQGTKLLVITCGDDQKIKVWDSAIGTQRYAFEEHTAPIYSICPHAKEAIHFIFSTSSDGKIKVWLYDDYGARVDYDAPGRGRTAMTYSVDGRRLFSCGTNVDGESFLVEWDENEGVIKRKYKGLGENSVDVVQFDISKSKYLAAGDEHLIKFWDMDSAELLTTTDADGNLPARPCIKFNNEGTLLAVIAEGNMIKVLGSHSCADVLQRLGSLSIGDFNCQHKASKLKANPDLTPLGAEFAGGTVNNKDHAYEDVLKLQASPSLTSSRTEVAKETVSAVVDDPRNLTVLKPNNAAASEKSKVIQSFPEDSSCQSLSLQLHPLLKSEKVAKLIYTNAGNAIVALLAPLAVHLVWQWPLKDLRSDDKATAKISPQLWTPRRGPKLMRNELGDAPPHEVLPCLALSKNDSYLLSAYGGTISLFNMISFRRMVTIRNTPPVATCIAYHPQDNNIIAIGMDDSTIHIYNVRLSMIKAKLEGHRNRVTGLAFSNSLNVLVSSGKDAQIFVWEAEGWNMQRTVSLQSSNDKRLIQESDTHVQFHCNQMHFLVVSKNQIALYYAKELACLKQWIPGDISSSESNWFSGSVPMISDATFSCDGQMVYVSFVDGSVFVLGALQLEIRYRINQYTYLPQVISSDVYPTVITAHPQIPTQFAVGLSTGGVLVIEPAEDNGQWGPK